MTETKLVYLVGAMVMQEGSWLCIYLIPCGGHGYAGGVMVMHIPYTLWGPWFGGWLDEHKAWFGGWLDEHKAKPKPR